MTERSYPDIESGTVAGRLADIIEHDKPTLWLGRYRLSESDRDVVFSALRAAALRATQPAHGSPGSASVSIELMQRVWDNLYFDKDEMGTFQQTLNEVVDWLASWDALPSTECRRSPDAAQSGRNDALRLLAYLFTEAEHETWRKQEIVNIIEDAIRLGSPQSSTQPSCHGPDDAFCMVCNPPVTSGIRESK